MHVALCKPQDITTADYWRSAVVLLGTTLVLAGLHILLKRTFGDGVLIEAFGTSTFPVAVVVSSYGTYFKRYSRAARMAIIGGLLAVLFLISLVAAASGRLI